MLLTQRREKSIALLFARFGETTYLLPSAVSTHDTQAFHRLTQECIIEAAGGFQVGTEVFGLCFIGTQGQFD